MKILSSKEIKGKLLLIELKENNSFRVSFGDNLTIYEGFSEYMANSSFNRVLTMYSEAV